MELFRVWVLTLVGSLSEWALEILMIFLTSVWKLHVSHAAAIVNVFGGTAKILPVAMHFLSLTYMGNYGIVIVSTIAYSIGLSFLAICTLPVSQLIFLYTSLALVAIGISGQAFSVPIFILQNHAIQLQDTANMEDMGTILERNFAKIFIGIAAIVLVLIVGSVTLPFIQAWSVLFGVPAVLTAVATCIFLSGSSSYSQSGPSGFSPLILNVFRVFVASARKTHLQVPLDSSQLYERHDLEDELLRHTSGLNFLDKAAIIVPLRDLEEQEHNKWELCRVSKVEEVKIFVRMIPMWMTLVVCGIIYSIGNTFFLEQAINTNRKIIWNLKVPLPIFIIFCHNLKWFRLKLSRIERALGDTRRKYAPAIGIAVSMVMSILCCIIAARVEIKRLDTTKCDKTPMSIRWLVLQFLLLNAFDELLQKSVICFVKGHIPASMVIEMGLLTDAVTGVGFIGSMVLRQVASRAWFQETLDKSSLDSYYWMLAKLGFINLVFYILVALCYNYKEYPAEEEVQQQRQNQARFPDEEWARVHEDGFLHLA